MKLCAYKEWFLGDNSVKVDKVTCLISERNVNLAKARVCKYFCGCNSEDYGSSHLVFR